MDPLRFFEGKTESAGTLKVALKKPIRTLSVGRGRIQPDGSLLLIQQVKEGTAPGKERRWHVRRAGPNRFSATMSEALGPVTIEHVGDRYHFRFRMKGGLSVDQWIKPLPSGTEATTRMTVRKLGVKVATSTGTIRRLPGR